MAINDEYVTGLNRKKIRKIIKRSRSYLWEDLNK